MLVTMSLLATLGGVLAPSASAATGTVLFQNSFEDNTVDGTGTVTVPSPASGTNAACLTASGNTATSPLLSCAGNVDTQGSGKLRMTGIAFNQVGGVFGQSSFPTSNGLDVTFNSYQWGGGSADGISFMLAAVDPANPVAPTSIGSSGGALGYSAAPGLNGLSNAYMGIGLDAYGNFSNSSYSGTGCAGNIPNFGAQAPGTVAIRGPGNLRVGYCGLNTTYNGTPASKLIIRGSTRAASVVPVEVLINPTVAPFTSSSGITVTAGTYKIAFTPVGGSQMTLSGTLPTVAAGPYPSTSWLNANGVPKQLAFGFVGSTGSVDDAHEVSDVKALTFNPVPQLAVSTTSYSAATSTPGAPVSYNVVASVLSGAKENSPISVTQTTPAGVVPVGAFGTGWVCQAPVGQTVTCTTSASSFTNGTALPAITVVAIATGASVTSTTIQNSSTTRVSSADANPATATVTTVGTQSSAPTGVTVSPSIGPIAGGALTFVTALNNNVSPIAIEIGTTAQQQAGTPLVLLPCASGRAVGCFDYEGTTLVILSMPAVASAATETVTVVALGAATSTTYVYADKPATMAAPTATAGISGVALNWTAPAANGSAITGYVVTPYLAGVAQTPQSFGAGATTGSVTGLTAGGSYTFTVAAVNAYGTGTASPASAAVVPYALPGAPSITAVSAGSLSATLSWSAPAANGSAITGYVVTPYIGTVAQPTQTFTGTATTRTVTGLNAGTAYTFTVAAQNLAGTGLASAKSASVTPNQSPNLTFAAPPTGEVATAYSDQLTVANGTTPFVWSVSSGTLPGGLTLNAATGLLSGTPTTAGSFPFVVQVTDASGQSATKAVTLIIAGTPGLTFTAPPGEVGLAYNQHPVLTGGTGPFAWTVTAGALPAGITLNPTTGQLSGTPTSAGSFSFTTSVTDAFGQIATLTVTLVVVALPTFTATTPPAGQIGVGYGYTFAVAGGTLPLAWSVSAGSLPPGLAFNTSTGTLSGTPTTLGSSPFTVSVTDANGRTATVAVTVVIGTGPLVITKTANVSSAVAGSVVSYTITVANTGSTAFTGVALSDPLTGVLDDAGYNGNASTTGGTVSYTAPNLGWTGNIGAASTVTISYSVTVNNPDTGNKILANTVTSTTLGTNCGTGSSDPRCSATVTVPGLTIVKTANVATTTPGSVVRFTIVVTNAGQTAYPAATLTDSLAGALDDATYNADGTATSGSVSYGSPSLSWTGSLAVGASATITYSVTVNNPDTGDRSMTGTIVSPSVGSPCPSGNPAAQCTATVTVLVPALSITSSTSTGSTTPGGTVGYTVTLANTGQTSYTATSVTIALAAALDDAVYNNDATVNSGGVVYNPGSQSLVWTGDLAVGATVVITASLTVRSPDPGDKTLTTVTSSTAPGSSCPVGGTNPLCTTTVQVLLPGLVLTSSTDVSSTTPGSVVHYTILATNSGQTPYAGATFSVGLTGILDDATYDSDGAATAGAVALSGSTLTWTGNLLVGASATISYSVTVNNPDTGDRTLTATVVSAAAGNNCPAAGTDPGCATSVTVLVPGLNVAIASDASATTTPGSVVHYTVTLVNTGQTTYSGAAVTLDLGAAVDDATYDNDATITTGSLQTNPDGTVNWVLNLAPGATATGTVSLTVNNPDTGDKILKVAVVTDAVGSTCPTGSSNPACATTATVLIPGLTITKTASTTTALPGGTIGYTVTVVNSGQTAYAAAAFSDSLRAVLNDTTYNGDVSATSGVASYAAPTLSWSGALAVGASATITYSVTVLNPDPGDKLVANTVVSTSAGNNCPAGGTDPRCGVAVFVLVPALTIATTANAATTTPGAVVDYTVTATNSGATAYPVVTFTDSLTGILDDAAYNGDATAGTGTVSAVGTNLSWTGALAIGATVTVTFSVTVHAAPGGDNLMTNSVNSTAVGNNCATGSSDTRCSATVPVARLVLAWGAMASTAVPGAAVRFTQTYTNTGQVPYTGISVDVLAPGFVDDALPGGDQTASSGTLSLGTTNAIWTGSIPVGGVVTLSDSVIIKNPDTGDGILTATTVSTAPGNNCPDGSTDARCAVTVTVTVPGLTITKAANTTAVPAGGAVDYTITVANSGQTAYTGAVVTDSLVGILDKASYGGNATATAGTVTFTSSNLSWTGDLAVGASAVITYSITVPSAPTGDKTLVNTVSSTAVGSTCPPSSGSPACQSIVAILTPVLTIVKTANLTNATLGSTVDYTVQVANAGQTYYPAAAFTDPLSSVLDDATYNDDVATTGGTVGYASGVLSWSGALAPGDSATITYSVTINNPSTADRTMTNTVSSTSPGSDCATGSEDSRCTATVSITDAVSLTFTKTADVAATAAGGTVGYTVTATNSSTSDVDSANFTDPLAGILDDATFGGTATASAGTVTYASPNLTWSGTVPAGGTVTVTYSVTVDSAATGDDLLTGTISSTSLPDSDNCVAGSTDPRCTNTVPVASLAIQQHYLETSTTPGSVVHLTATFTNTGQFPYNGIAISSPAADTVDDATPNGDQSATSGTLVLGAAGIVWTGDIPVGGVVTVTGSLTVQNPDPGNRLLTGTLVSTALGNTCPPGGTATACTASLPVLLPGLTITKTADTTYVVPGGTAGYTITIHDSGQTPYTGATVTDTLGGVLDDATYNANAAASTGTVSYASPVLTWTGDLAVGDTATITYSVTANSPDLGDKTMVNPVESTDVGSTCPPASGNPACEAVVAVLTPALTITSATSVPTTVPGAIVGYTVTATNTGQFPYPAATFGVDLSDVLDDATYNGDAAASTGTVGITGTTLTWTGALNPGATVSVTYTVTVNNPNDEDDFVLNQTVSSTSQGSNCAASSTDPRCASTLPVASLHVLTSTDVSTTQPTGVVHYTNSYTNIGQVPYFGISLTENFAGALDDATYNGDASSSSGNLVLDPTTGLAVWTGDLAVGASVTITGSLTVENPDPGDKIMTTVITSTAPANNCTPGSTDPDCRTSVPVLTPTLSITKSASTSSTTPGSAVGYTITIANSGQTAYPAATVRDALGGVLTDATYLGDATTTGGTLSFASPTLTWTGGLAVDQSVVISYSVRVNDPDLGDKTLDNTVSSDDLGSTCPSGGSDPGCSAVVDVLVPALDIAVASDSTTTVPGAAVGYTVTITNAGQIPYLGASVTTRLAGVLDDARYDGDATATGGTLSFSSPNLIWTGDLAIGASTIISYTVTVAAPDTGDHLLSTSATSDAPGSTCGGAAQCANTVTVLIPGLAVSTAANVATAMPGDPVVFTITVSNTGQTPYPDAAVSTSLAGVLDDATFDGQVTSSIGVATYTAPRISWTGDLPVGSTATISYTVSVDNPDTGNKVLTTTAIAPAAGSTCQAGSTDPACTATVTVLVPGLTITKTASTSSTTPGSVVGYTILISNSGQTAYTGAVVTDSLAGVLPDADYNDDAAVTGGGTLAFTTPALNWTGDLLAGASATITYSITVHNPDTGDKQIINTVVSTAPGSSCPPGGTLPACSTQVQVLVPALVITKTADTSEVAAGNAVHYTVTLVNTGQTAYLPATFTDALGGVLGAARYDGDATASSGTVEYLGGTLLWTGALGIGATATVTYSVTTDYPVGDDRILTNTAVSGSPGANCPLGGADPRCTSVVDILVPALTVTKTVDTEQVVAGGTVRYTISATNTGQAGYPAATLTDSLAGLLDDGVYNGDVTATTGTVGYSGGTLSWTGSLPVGANVLIGYSITTTVGGTGDDVLTNRVVSTSVGSNCAADSVDPGCATSTPIAAGTLTLSDLTPSFTLTGLPDSTVTTDGALTMTVTTNNPAGYVVTVQAATAVLASATTANPATIPIDALRVRETGRSSFQTLSTNAASVVHQQDGPSAPGGDAVSNDYQVQIPDVSSDDYSATLDYVVSSQ